MNRSRLGSPIAIVLYCICVGALFQPIWQLGVRDFVTATATLPNGRPSGFVGEGDTIFVAARIRRNAAALAENPLTIFDQEPCAPDEKSLATADPMIAAAAVAMPAHFAGAGAGGAYNLAAAASIVLKALAMFLLVREWTASVGAALCAGLLFAFNPIALRDISHFYIGDTSWTVFALFFSYRWLRTKAWRYSVATALFLVMQMANCFYPTVAAVAIGLPYALWLLTDRQNRLSFAQMAVAAAICIAGAWFVYQPYLDSTTGNVIDFKQFSIPTSHLPSQQQSVGWPLFFLSVAGLAIPLRRSAPELDRDPRPALAAGLALCLWMSWGWFAPFFNLYRMVESTLPGFSAVRAPARIGEGAQIALAVFAGFAIAAALRSTSDRFSRQIASIAAVVALSTTSVLAIRNADPPYFREQKVSPNQATLLLFTQLERTGNLGPIVELPYVNPLSGLQHAQSTMTSTYHGRRTSACYGSLKSKSFMQLRELTMKLPADSAILGLRDLGFTTIVFHHEHDPNPWGLRSFTRHSKASPLFAQVAHTKTATAFQIRQPTPH